MDAIYVLHFVFNLLTAPPTLSSTCIIFLKPLTGTKLGGLLLVNSLLEYDNYTCMYIVHVGQSRIENGPV